MATKPPTRSDFEDFGQLKWQFDPNPRISIRFLASQLPLRNPSQNVDFWQNPIEKPSPELLKISGFDDFWRFRKISVSEILWSLKLSILHTQPEEMNRWRPGLWRASATATSSTSGVSAWHAVSEMGTSWARAAWGQKTPLSVAGWSDLRWFEVWTHQLKIFSAAKT